VKSNQEAVENELEVQGRINAHEIQEGATTTHL
jgi:hypothetical protein